MHFKKAIGVIAAVGIGVALWRLPGTAEAQAAPPQSADKSNPADDLQRSVRIYNYKMTAESGPQRGEVIYFYKCWMCHNRYTKSAPYLSDLFKRPKLVSGEPVNENTVRAQISNGSSRMPAFRYTLSDADMKDLLSYLQ